MSVVIILLALAFLMFMAYKGHSVILFAPIAALLAVLFTAPADVLPTYTGLFMTKMVTFIQSYFPIFLLGALFGKLMEISGFAASIVEAILKVLGPKRAMLAIVLVGAILTYGGVSLFVAVFAVYPFAAEMFRKADIPKRLIPATITLGAISFTMDSLPGTPQIQNIIPTTFFHTTSFAAPTIGIIGSVLIFSIGLTYLEWKRRQAAAKGEGYGEGHINEPKYYEKEGLPHWAIAALPLVAVWVCNIVLTNLIPNIFAETIKITASALGQADPIVVVTKSNVAIWALICALLLGVVTVFIFGGKRFIKSFTKESQHAIAGSLLATMNTASEFGFGGVIASLAGFGVLANGLRQIPNPLLNIWVTVNVLAGATGSASGGLSIALAAMSKTFTDMANASGIPLEVVHRIASMASGGMDTLPHNGAIITLLAVTGLTHKQSYKDIFAITLTKTFCGLLMVGVYSLTHWV